MGSISQFVNSFTPSGLMGLLVSVAASLVCITFHEMSHGYVAYRLGDPTAKQMGRLSWNPIRHIDPIGLLMMITVKVGWAKAVPVDMRYFKHPKRDMAITALAGPCANFLMALAALAVSRLLLFLPLTIWTEWGLIFLSRVALLSVGLGVFNLIPVSPLDGSKILFSLLPDRWYYTILRYERYGMIAMVALVWLGVFDRPLSWLIYGGLELFCGITRFPIQLLLYLIY